MVPPPLRSIARYADFADGPTFTTKAYESIRGPIDVARFRTGLTSGDKRSLREVVEPAFVGALLAVPVAS